MVAKYYNMSLIFARFVFAVLALCEFCASFRLHFRTSRLQGRSSLHRPQNTEEFHTPLSSPIRVASENETWFDPLSSPIRVASENESWFDTVDNHTSSKSNIVWQDALNDTANTLAVTVPLEDLEVLYSLDSSTLEEHMKGGSIGDIVGLVDTDEVYSLEWLKWPDWDTDLEPQWVFRAYAKTVSAMDEIGLVKYVVRGLPAKEHDTVSRRCTPDVLDVYIENVFVNDQWKGMGNCKPLFYWAVKDVEQACQKPVVSVGLTFAAFDHPLAACGCYIGAGSLLGFKQLDINGDTYPKQSHWASKDQIKSFCNTHFQEADGERWTFNN